jgi:hypothetical protein
MFRMTILECHSAYAVFLYCYPNTGANRLRGEVTFPEINIAANAALSLVRAAENVIKPLPSAAASFPA